MLAVVRAGRTQAVGGAGTMATHGIEVVVEATPRPRLGHALRELWAFRNTIMAFAERDIRVKYKQAALGVAWGAPAAPWRYAPLRVSHHWALDDD